MTTRLLLVALTVLAAAPAAAQPSGAASCSGCHAAAGPVPSLEGRPAAEIAAAMAAFRSGERPATVMDRIAKGFTDEETRAIAEWLAARDHRDHAARP
ncbi:cytochrome C [Mycobacterium sp. KBS0706]|uniref:c-type cytochrome n=1 Tax=Mycobacterium sp. KBS0706 TaxID=2578109 RepID=UPI00110F8C71|nr:c-type cytochrome [Mycobacterium sp. KBS0706]TSD89402.1 cytochrome C [Mycobacterium sp. KBS0706]